jgi:hypothetical protein
LQRLGALGANDLLFVLIKEFEILFAEMTNRTALCITHDRRYEHGVNADGDFGTGLLASIFVRALRNHSYAHRAYHAYQQRKAKE